MPRLGYADPSNQARFVSAFSTKTDQHFIGILDSQGKLLHQIAVPSRGHSASISSDGKLAAFFARRPRRWLLVVDVTSGEKVGEIEAEAGRHFFGHGVFSADNRYLYTTENDFDNNRGIVGIYSVGDAVRKESEMLSFGVGPHELALLSDAKTLVVCNGGIETHPSYGRQKLNLDTMQPSLTYIDIPTQTQMSSVQPPHHQLSLRHMALTQDDTIVVGAQYQGAKSDLHPLVFTHRLGQASLCPMNGQSDTHLRRLKHYIASVAVSYDGRIAITSSPRGDRVSVWDVPEGQWIKDLPLPDIGGVSALASGGVLLSSGNGSIYRSVSYGAPVKVLAQHPDLHWDNHLKHV